MNSSDLKIIISNGFNRFPLAYTAAELHRRGMLCLLITGAYPTSMVRRVSESKLKEWLPRLGRLLDRGEALPDRLVRSLWLPELVYEVGMMFRRVGWPNRFVIEESVQSLAFQFYGRRAAHYVATTPARLYHYRAGFGGYSVEVAKGKGLVTLCDHSIAHPEILAYLLTNQGTPPESKVYVHLNQLWQRILQDIEQADHVVAESDFEKRGFVTQGYRSDKVHVLYRGVDDKFLNSLPVRSSAPDFSRPTLLMFAGEFGVRKGGNVLINALQRLNDTPWRIRIAGSIEPSLKQEYAAFFHDSRVTVLGTIPREELAERMSEAEVFVFPSLAEGSVRVVFEALAAGCYVITTPNAGSIVEDGIHGKLVPPGDPQQLAAAIRDAASNRRHMAEVGRRNAELIRARYRQSDYGDALAALYSRLLADRSNAEPCSAAPSTSAAI